MDCFIPVEKGGRRNPSVPMGVKQTSSHPPWCSSLLPSASADVRSSVDVIALSRLPHTAA